MRAKNEGDDGMGSLELKTKEDQSKIQVETREESLFAVTPIKLFLWLLGRI